MSAPHVERGPAPARLFGVRVLRKSWTWFTLATVVAVVAVEWSVAAIAAGLAGAAVGVLVGLNALQVGMLVGGLAFGDHVHRIVFGFGARVRDWTTTQRAIVLRRYPLLLFVSVGPSKAPARPRLWLAALCAVLTGLLVSAAFGWAALTAWDTPFVHGLAIASLAAVLQDVVPRKDTGGTSLGFVLLRYPTLTGEHAARLDAAPLVNATIDAAKDGDLVTADRLAAALADQHPRLRAALAARIVVHQAHGNFAMAMALAVTLASDPTQEPHEAALSFAILGGMACATVEAGQLPAEVGLPAATTALENAETLGYPRYKLNGTLALLEVLSGGDPAKAVRLATMASQSDDGLIDRADGLATLAGAHMAAGDNKTARVVLDKAEQLAPWWPRVAQIRSRLSLS